MRIWLGRIITTLNGYLSTTFWIRKSWKQLKIQLLIDFYKINNNFTICINQTTFNLVYLCAWANSLQINIGFEGWKKNVNDFDEIFVKIDFGVLYDSVLKSSSEIIVSFTQISIKPYN